MNELQALILLYGVFNIGKEFISFVLQRRHNVKLLEKVDRSTEKAQLAAQDAHKAETGVQVMTSGVEELIRTQKEYIATLQLATIKTSELSDTYRKTNEQLEIRTKQIETRLNNRIAEYATTLDNMSREQAEKEAARQQDQAIKEQASKERDEKLALLSSEITDMKNRVDNSDQTLLATAKKLQETETALTEARTRADDLEQKLALAEKRITQLESEKTSERQLAAQEKEALTVELNAERLKVTRLQEQVTELTRQIDGLKQRDSQPPNDGKQAGSSLTVNPNG